MTDYSKLIVENLNVILPTYYELFCDSETPKPCITYMMSNDAQDKTGDTLGYSNVRYTIKIWGDDLSVINPDMLLVDAKMRSLGFKRVSANDLTFDSHICKIMIYEGLSKEEFTI